jgi:hypothetical protein
MFPMSRDHPWYLDTHCTGEYPYTLPGCALGHHYKVVQWFSPVCRIPAEVSPEVSVQITKGPLLCHVVLRRVHSLSHSFPTKRIPRESTHSAPPIGTPNLVLPHTTPGRTHIGSWLYYFHGWSLHEPVLRFGYDVYHRLSESTRQAPNCRSPQNTVPNSSPQIPILHTNREQQWLTGRQ